MKELEEWVIGSDKKPTMNLYDNTGEAILINSLLGYGIRLWNAEGSVIGSYGVNMSGFSATEIVNIGDSSFDVVLDKSINTVEGIVRARIYTIWADTDFTDTNFDDIGGNINLYNSVNQ